MISMPTWLYVGVMVAFLVFNIAVITEAVRRAHKEGLIDDFLAFLMIPMLYLLGIILAVQWPLYIIIAAMIGITYGVWKLYERKSKVPVVRESETTRPDAGS